MPLSLIHLDTTYPPTWDGTELGVDPVLAPHTRLRQTNGHDPVNYFADQRVEGDLLHRDLVLEMNMKKLIDFVETVQGFKVNIPSTMIAPGAEIEVAQLFRGDYKFYRLLGMGVEVQQGSAGADTGIRCLHTKYDGGGVLISTAEEAGEVTTTKGSTFHRNEPVEFTDSIVLDPTVKVFNDSASFIAVSAWAMFSPILDDDLDVDGMYYATGTALSVTDPNDGNTDGPTNLDPQFHIDFTTAEPNYLNMEGNYYLTELVDLVNSDPIYANESNTYAGGDPTDANGLRLYDRAYDAVNQTNQLNYRFGDGVGDVINILTTTGTIYYADTPGDTPDLGVVTDGGAL